ncbi:MAG: hypothetical protein Q7T30_02180 [Planctomycetota bacterium]|nr:hypothetical protein [Planctomycetota bacterium]
MRNLPELVATTAVAFLTIAPAARCQQLVADLRTTSTVAPSSNPVGLLALPGFTAFRATTKDSGDEPWVTDGSAAGTFRLRDLVPGSAGSSPTMLGEFQGELLFSAILPGSGYGLYRSDGTTAGTHSIGNLGVGQVTALVRLANGNALLLAGNSTYATDLTPAGTQLIPGMQQLVAGTALGSITIGTCQGANNLFDLWATDGTVAGSHLVQTGISTQRPANFVVRNGRACFVEVATGANVWVDSTDGITVTRHAHCGSFFLAPMTGRVFLSGNRLLFLLRAVVTPSQLFCSDLTAAGTGLVPTACQDLGELAEYGGALYLHATTAANGYELWTTDGTTAGTTLVADLVPGTAGAHPEQLLATPHGLFFRSLDSQGGRVLRLLTSPTNIQNLGPIPTGALVSNVVPWQDGLLFPAGDSAGVELWFGGATSAPARLVDIDATAPGITTAYQAPTAAARDRLFLFADDGTHGIEIWSSDGSAAGTTLLDLRPGTASSYISAYAPPPQLAFYRDRMAFSTAVGAGLTDGSNVVSLHPQASTGPVRVFDQLLYFVGGSQLMRSDGTPGGTQVVSGMGTISYVTDFRVLPGRIVLLSGAQNVWGTDGVSNPVLLVGEAGNLIGSFDSRALFTSGSGLYATDGTVAGTVPLNTRAFSQYGLKAFAHSVAYAVAMDATVWQSDGTSSGTALVATIPGGMTLDSLLPTDRELFAVATTAATGRELWKLDRSAGQFVLIADLAVGVTSGVAAASVLGEGDLLLLAAGDDATGSELYVSNGTASGTYLVADLAPGRASSNPRLLGIADATIYFTADDGVHGNELWAMPTALVGAANQQEIGFGCVGSAGIPTLATTAAPRLGNANFGYRASRLPSLAPILFGIATDDGAQSLGGCTLHLGGTIATQFRLATAAGAASISLPVPASNALLGLRLAAQAFPLDGLAPAGFAASSGSLIVVGN